MDILNTFKISGSALKANKIRLDTISSNMANIETTSTPEGGPYKKKSVYFQSTPVTFQQHLEGNMANAMQGVKVTKILEDESEPKKIYDPSHPDAAEDGYLAMPNINLID